MRVREKEKKKRERRERESQRLRKKRIESKEKKYIILIIHPCYSVVLYTHTYCSENVKKIGFTHLDEGCFYKFGG